jgi:hypothetical protein
MGAADIAKIGPGCAHMFLLKAASRSFRKANLKMAQNAAASCFIIPVHGQVEGAEQ